MTDHQPEFVSERFGDHHDAASFGCGQPALDEWLRRHARDSDGRGLTRTWVWTRPGDPTVVGYFSLMPFTIQREQLTKKQGRGLPNSIPAYLLARLALDDEPSLRGRRLGVGLLADALSRVARVADDAGGRFVVVDAIDEAAVGFYVGHGFEKTEPDPNKPDEQRRLLIRIKDVVTHLGV